MKAFRWIIINGFFTAMLWFGGYQDIIWAKNIFLFMVWFIFIGTVFCIFHEESHQRLFDKGPSIPSKIAVIYGIIMTLGIVALGWFIIAIIYIIASSCEYTIFTVSPKKDKKE